MDSGMRAQNLPYGAAEIVALRTAGKRPADMILVSLIGPLAGETNPVLIAKPERSYDWRFLVGLEVTVIVQTSTPNLAGIVKAIQAITPTTLSVWFAEQQDGINVVIDSYTPKSKSGRRMALQQRITLAGIGSMQSREACLAKIASEAKRQAMANSDQFDAALIEAAHAGFRRMFGQTWGAAA
jgi:hypothetical protein